MEEERWYTIETAPVNTRVLVFVPIRNHRMVIGMKTEHGGIWLQENEQPMSYPPTHWMPLPAPPVDAYV